MSERNPTFQVSQTQGGTRVANLFSGSAGGDTCLWSGTGRLDAAFFHNGSQLALSGQSWTFYDGAAAVSGGPLPSSGHKIVGVLGVPTATGLSPAASGDVFLGGGPPTPYGFMFYSGLCVASRSGQIGMSVSFTPVSG